MTEREREDAMALLETLDLQLTEARDRVQEAEYDARDIERRIQLTHECFPEIRDSQDSA